MRVRVFAVIVALSLSTSVRANQGKPDDTKNHSTQAQGPAYTAPVVLIDQSDAKPNQYKANSHSDGSQNLRATLQERLIDPVTWFTLLLVIVSWCQWRAMQRQSEHMRKGLNLTRRSNRSSRIAAEAAKSSADGLKNAERAYIGIRERLSDAQTTQLGPFRQYKSENPNRYRLDISIVNSGRTPASIDGGMVQCVRDLKTVGFEPPLTLPKDKSRISGDFLHAGNSSRQMLVLDVSAEAIEALLSKNVWLVGFVDYRDAFKTTHRAGYCRRLSRKKDSKILTLFVDTSCEPYNYDDEIDEHGNRKKPKWQPDAGLP